MHDLNIRPFLIFIHAVSIEISAYFYSLIGLSNATFDQNFDILSPVIPTDMMEKNVDELSEDHSASSLPGL